ncbi:MAG: nucleotidyltransferase domain-containing protein [Chromatiaceae bacterium]|nr:nucleotidyltransferase domain-containing protein [Chromatiaceae bacterium]MBP8285107.1 nucleotidyltransferase domain-containing protein [Chromatiaceae bacterium]
MTERTLPAMPQANSMVTDLDEIARDIINATVGAVAPEQIVLFGSRARGDNGPDSDLDLLVVARDSFTPEHTRQGDLRRIRQAIRPFRLPVDVLLYSHDEIDTWRQSPNHVIGRSLREGLTVYERS